jgi:hypothetical protein
VEDGVTVTVSSTEPDTETEMDGVGLESEALRLVALLSWLDSTLSVPVDEAVAPDAVTVVTVPIVAVVVCSPQFAGVLRNLPLGG